MRKSVREIFIDLSGLGAEDKQDWLSLIDLTLQALGLQPSIGHFSGHPKDDAGDFAYIADSAGFSPWRMHCDGWRYQWRLHDPV